MSNLAEILEEELEEAFEVKNKKSLHRYISLLTDNIAEKNEYQELKSDVKLIAETMKQGFENMNKRFEAVDKRFEDMYKYMDKRFEAVDKRFEAVDKRFDDMNKKISILIWVMSLWMGLFSGISVILKFIK